MNQKWLKALWNEEDNPCQTVTKFSKCNPPLRTHHPNCDVCAPLKVCCHIPCWTVLALLFSASQMNWSVSLIFAPGNSCANSGESWFHVISIDNWMLGWSSQPLKHHLSALLTNHEELLVGIGSVIQKMHIQNPWQCCWCWNTFCGGCRQWKPHLWLSSVALLNHTYLMSVGGFSWSSPGLDCDQFATFQAEKHWTALNPTRCAFTNGIPSKLAIQEAPRSTARFVKTE